MSFKLIANLRRLHLKLDHEIQAERARRLPDAVRLARLKKTKLKVKDRMTGIDRSLAFA
ncbi:YdcH family protein [Sandaracinobacteroides saxicola]|uniref:YdcH family protein n=1 Tax=Sandaracinobacteroides saxicola TaxID=2759707 RepID=A0A7G5IJK9_9SPHN|nr:YdcH family protein [Sandaracinobacteroides saxicola]QMW23551.1 YdcH family protein [Sandaracinobacteroides saxicola]